MDFGIINHNVQAINSLRRLKTTSASMNKNYEKLSSGLRINRAADDAAGLAVSEKMRSQIYGLEQAKQNTQDGISMIQTAEGVMDTLHSILQRMRTLAIQAASDNYTTNDRMKLQSEIDQLIDEVDRVSEYTEFNTKKLLNGDSLGKANTSNRRVLTADVTGIVVDADYSITILDAGTASNVHGNSNIVDVPDDSDSWVTLKDAGIYGEKELHIVVDNKTAIVMVDEDDTLDNLVNKINLSGAGVVAGLDEEGNDITMTSMRSGPKYNISFGDDPDGVALALGFYGGVPESNTSSIRVMDSTGNYINRRVFTSGSHTIISITNITHQEIFQTVPGKTSMPGGYGRSLGVFASESRTFSAKELSNPLNVSITTDPTRPLWNLVNGMRHSVDLNASNLLKGFSFTIDEQIDYGVLQQDNNNNDDGNFTSYWPNPNGIPIGDPNAYDYTDYRSAVPGEEEYAYADYMSLTHVRLAVRDRRQAYHIGANQNQVMLVDYPNFSAEILGLTTNLRASGGIYNGVDPLLDGSLAPDFRMHMSIRTRKDAEHAIGIIDDAIENVSQYRSKLGAFQNSMEKTVDYLGISHENMTASESRIRDVDMAKEMSELTKNQILLQSGTSMLAQANQKNQQVLSLLG